MKNVMQMTKCGEMAQESRNGAREQEWRKKAGMAEESRSRTYEGLQGNPIWL
jgi:hypothetical protein